MGWEFALYTVNLQYHVIFLLFDFKGLFSKASFDAFAGYILTNIYVYSNIIASKITYSWQIMSTIDIALICKALGDANRLKIVQMLSDSEKCGCKLLEQFEISQPTLSHHMRILVECSLVNERKESKWRHYSLNDDALINLKVFFDNLTGISNSTEKIGDCL